MKSRPRRHASCSHAHSKSVAQLKLKPRCPDSQFRAPPLNFQSTSCPQHSGFLVLENKSCKHFLMAILSCWALSTSQSCMVSSSLLLEVRCRHGINLILTLMGVVISFYRYGNEVPERLSDCTRLYGNENVEISLTLRPRDASQERLRTWRGTCSQVLCCS